MNHKSEMWKLLIPAILRTLGGELSFIFSIGSGFHFSHVQASPLQAVRHLLLLGPG